MKIQQLVNATIRLQYAGVTFLIDPMLGPKGSSEAYPSLEHPNQRNPIVDQPVPVEQLLDYDALIVTHLSSDHFDAKAIEIAPREKPLLALSAQDAWVLARLEFLDIRVIGEDTVFEGVHLARTEGRKGSTAYMIRQMGKSGGAVFRAPQQKTIYLTGDTLWFDGVRRALDTYHPDIIIANCGGNRMGKEQVVMGREDVLRLHQHAPDALIIASHMEAVNHWTLSRQDLRTYALSKGFSDQLLIPENGEIMEF